MPAGAAGSGDLWSPVVQDAVPEPRPARVSIWRRRYSRATCYGATDVGALTVGAWITVPENGSAVVARPSSALPEVNSACSQDRSGCSRMPKLAVTGR